MRRFYKLLAPVMIAASFPAMAQDTAVDAPQATETATTEQDQKVQNPWTARTVLMDETPLNEKIDRAYSDEQYLDALQSLIKEDRDNNLISTYREVEAAAYLTLLEATINPNITAEMLAAHAELDNENDNYKTIDKNYDDLLACRDKAPKIENLYLKHQHIRGCAITAINAPPAPEPKIVYEGIAGIGENALAAPYSLSEKLRAYQSNLDKYDDYQSAVQAERAHLIDNDYIAKMYNRDAIRLADFILDPTVKYETLNNIPDEGDTNEREFKWRDIGSSNVDNNIKFVQQCRSKIVPNEPPTDIQSRQKLLDEVIVCAQNATRADDMEIANDSDNVEIDSSSLFEKHHAYKSGEENVVFAEYRQNVRTLADQSNIVSSKTNYYNAMRLWDAMLDTSVTWDELKVLRNNDDPHNLEFNWFTTSPEPDRNMRFMFECRAKHVPDNLSKTDMTQRRATFNAVTQCWTEKNAPHAERINKDRAEQAAKRAEIAKKQKAEAAAKQQAEQKKIQEDNAKFFKFVISLLMCGGTVAGIGFGARFGYRKWKSRPKKKKKLDW